MKIGAEAMKNGTIIIRTNNPEFESSGQGGALVDDVLAYRLAMQHKSNDGYTKNPILDNDKWDSSKELNGRMKLLWQPTGQKDTRLLLTLARQEKEIPKNQNVSTVIPTNGSDPLAQEDIFKRQAYMNTPWDIKRRPQHRSGLKVINVR
jgi:hypothetical protein